MLDIKFIRDNADIVKSNIMKKNQDDKIVLVDQLIEEDKEYRALLKENEDLRAKRNKVSQSINEAKKAGEDASEFLAQAKEIPAKLKESEED